MSKYIVTYTDEIDNADNPKEAAQMTYDLIKETESAGFEVTDLKTGKTYYVYCK